MPELYDVLPKKIISNLFQVPLTSVALGSSANGDGGPDGMGGSPQGPSLSDKEQPFTPEPPTWWSSLEVVEQPNVIQETRNNCEYLMVIQS